MIVIVGGGASGFFAAVALKERMPQASVSVYEAQTHVLAKLALTGGGRCNLTNSFASMHNPAEVYPRGANLMKKCLHQFGWREAWQWFERHGVKLHLQEDGRVFPMSDNAAEVVGMFVHRAEALGVFVHTSCRLEHIAQTADGYSLQFAAGKPEVQADVVVLATGGFSSRQGEKGLFGLPLEMEKPVPSLFSFMVRDEGLRGLSGVSVPKAVVRLPCTRFSAEGALLVTHIGLSGPAVLKLSSYAARHLAGLSWHERLSVNWMGLGEGEILSELQQKLSENSARQLSSVRLEGLVGRLWLHLLKRSGIDAEMRCSGLVRKQLNRLVNTLVNDSYLIEGRAANKEEFVTCGGVALTAVRAQSLESVACPRLYIIGEALDIDAVTGGFNLQAAWTTAFVCATHVADVFCRLN